MTGRRRFNREIHEIHEGKERWIAALPSAARNDGEEERWIATLTLAMTYLGAVIANGVKQSGKHVELTRWRRRTLDCHTAYGGSQ